MQDYKVGDYVRVTDNLKAKADININREMLSLQGCVKKIISKQPRPVKGGISCVYKINTSPWSWTNAMLEPIEKKDLKNY